MEIPLTGKRLNDSDGKKGAKTHNTIENGREIELRREIKCVVLWSL